MNRGVKFVEITKVSQPDRVTLLITLSSGKELKCITSDTEPFASVSIINADLNRLIRRRDKQRQASRDYTTILQEKRKSNGHSPRSNVKRIEDRKK